MRKLSIPAALKQEFETVEALWGSKGETRRVDALVLSWVRYEKQLRRLLTFFVYQHPNTSPQNLGEVIAAFAENKNLYPEAFIAGIAALVTLQALEHTDRRFGDV